MQSEVTDANWKWLSILPERPSMGLKAQNLLHKPSIGSETPSGQDHKWLLVTSEKGSGLDIHGYRTVDKEGPPFKKKIYTYKKCFKLKMYTASLHTDAHLLSSVIDNTTNTPTSPSPLAYWAMILHPFSSLASPHSKKPLVKKEGKWYQSQAQSGKQRKTTPGKWGVFIK